MVFERQDHDVWRSTEDKALLKRVLFVMGSRKLVEVCENVKLHENARLGNQMPDEHFGLEDI